MVIFLILQRPGFIRYFEPSLRILAERGHRIHIGFPGRREGGAQARQWFNKYGAPRIQDAGGTMGLYAALARDHPGVSWGYVRQRRTDGWQALADDLRACRDHLRYFEPAFEKSQGLRDRSAYQSVPTAFVKLMQRPLARSAAGRRVLCVLLDACEDALPVSRSAIDEIRDVAPDLVLVSRLIDFGSPQADYVQAAQSLGIPVGLPVASWDNLTNKGHLRRKPDFMTVWNEAQKREAIELHGMAEDRILVTGAQLFDAWFGRGPSLDRQAFCARLGLDPDRLILTYLCSSRWVGADESGLVRHWLKSLRRSKQPRLRNANVIVRPYPKQGETWDRARLSDFDPVRIWPPVGTTPTTEAERNELFDTIHHSAAVVGLNTSALIEAAIIGRPVLVLIDPEHPTAESGTLGTLHFQHLIDPERGVADVSPSIKEHLRQLTRAISRPDVKRLRRFVQSFVRPNGERRPAAPILADAIERGAGMAPAARRRGPGPGQLATRAALFLLRPALTSALRQRMTSSDAPPLRSRKATRVAVKAARTEAKAARA